LKRKTRIFKMMEPIKFHAYIFNILKEIQPKKHTLEKAIVLMNNMINHLMETILNTTVE
jgi:hypothetical protein